MFYRCNVVKMMAATLAAQRATEASIYEIQPAPTTVPLICDVPPAATSAC